MYQVGFGDCFLLSFEYPQPLEDGRSERHILIDFGSTHPPWRNASLVDVANLIKAHCGEPPQLDVVVVTHRHKDHLEGFGNTAAADVIEGLAPKLIVRSWTEDPQADADAEEPSDRPGGMRAFLSALQLGQALATELGEAVGGARPQSLRGDLAMLSLDQVKNKAAVDRLERWGQSGAASFVFYGSESRIQEFVPGLDQVRVLGPPTINQWPEVAQQRAADPEYWMAHARLLSEALERVDLATALASPLPTPTPEMLEGPVRWLIERMEEQHIASLLRIVRILDDALNNTSVILLIDVGDKRMLFSGDAQIENWSYALEHADDSETVRRLLRRVDLYKVGHHGSRNATPRSLFRLWGFDPDPERPMVSLMSTLPKVHGESEATRVPRATLVEALERRTTLLSTIGLTKESPYIELEAPARGGTFSRVV